MKTEKKKKVSFLKQLRTAMGRGFYIHCISGMVCNTGWKEWGTHHVHLCRKEHITTDQIQFLEKLFNQKITMVFARGESVLVVLSFEHTIWEKDIFQYLNEKHNEKLSQDHNNVP